VNRFSSRTATFPIFYQGKRGDDAGKKIETPFIIMGGILTLASGWADTFGEGFQNSVSSLDEHSQIDIGCVLEKASYTLTYQETSYSLDRSQYEETLIYFFLKLLINLQKWGQFLPWTLRHMQER